MFQIVIVSMQLHVHLVIMEILSTAFAPITAPIIQQPKCSQIQIPTSKCASTSALVDITDRTSLIIELVFPFVNPITLLIMSA